MNTDREKIIKELRENPDGFTVSELSKKMSITRQTVANCFAFLEGREDVKIRKVGMAKVYILIKTGGKK